MAKRKKSVSRKRSPKQLKHDKCLKTQYKEQKIKLLEKPANRKLTPRKLNQKVFQKTIQACKK